MGGKTWRSSAGEDVSISQLQRAVRSQNRQCSVASVRSYSPFFVVM
jgi:hypothetical protein